MNPIIYKFGVQKSRIIVMAVFLIPSMLVAGLAMLMAGTNDGESSAFFDAIDKMDSISSAQIIGAEIGAVVFTAVFFALSMLLSMRIYKNKEL